MVLIIITFRLILPKFVKLPLKIHLFITKNSSPYLNLTLKKQPEKYYF